MSDGPWGIMDRNEFKRLYTDEIGLTLDEYNNAANEAIQERKLSGDCPKCGHRGEFIRMALCCPQHGVFGGC